MRTNLMKILSGERPLIDVWHYIVGNYRYKIYYSKSWTKHLMRLHIREQIDERIDSWMEEECFNEGSCMICGCETTALQMSNKSCDKPCYPTMMNYSDWDRFKSGRGYKDKSGTWVIYLLQNRLLLFKPNEKNNVPTINKFPKRNLQKKV